MCVCSSINHHRSFIFPMWNIFPIPHNNNDFRFGSNISIAIINTSRRSISTCTHILYNIIAGFTTVFAVWRFRPLGHPLFYAIEHTYFFLLIFVVEPIRKSLWYICAPFWGGFLDGTQICAIALWGYMELCLYNYYIPTCWWFQFATNACEFHSNISCGLLNNFI